MDNNIGKGSASSQSNKTMMMPLPAQRSSSNVSGVGLQAT